MIYGLEPRDGGEIYLNGRKIDIRNPRDAIRHGIVYLSDKRDEEELCLSLSVLKNVCLATLDKRAKMGFINSKLEKETVLNMVNEYGIACRSISQEVWSLSGGTKQKVALCKWLLTNADVILLDQPTEGIDIKTKIEIYRLLRELAKQGKAILTVLTEIAEVINVPDRILVMYEGRIVKEFKGGVSEKELLMSYYGRV